jgi:carbonic anhydrase
MCGDCGNPDKVHGISSARRGFLKLAAVGAIATLSRSAFAEAAKTPPKPENVISPDAALERLLAGNRRYIGGVSKRYDFASDRAALAKGQNPFAGILGCADSRVAPELAFDAGRGDLFVCRVAGNVATDEEIASFEYALTVLSTPLIMVLGHMSCGAVDAVLKSVKDNTTLPGHLPALFSVIQPAAKAALGQPGDALDNAIRQNVRTNVDRLKNATPIISQFVEEKRVRIVGAEYNLQNGKVELVS